MTVVTLPPEPRSVPPLESDAGTVRGFAADLLSASAQVDDLGGFAAGPGRIPSWHGRGAAAYHDAVAPLGRRADAMSLALRQVARRADQHADELQALARRHDGLLGERADLVATIAALRARAGAVDAAEAAEAAEVQAACEDCARRVRGFEAELDRWIADLRAEEAAMQAAFTRVLTLERVEQRYAGQPDPADRALDSMPGAGAAASAVTAWWTGLTRAEQQALVAAAPGSIGNRDGIPAAARHAANTVALDRDLADWERLEEQGLLTGDETGWLANARAARAAVEHVRGAEDPVTRAPVPAHLYVYDPAAFGGDGAVAVSAGDLDTAEDVAVTVPGFGTDAQSAPYQAERAVTVYEAARSVDGTAQVAAMFWIGYDAPDNLPWELEGVDAAGVAGEAMAAAGGERLADLVDGLRAAREDDAHLTVIGHSYGSTTTGHAAADHGLPVDDLVLVGSPGAGGDTDHVTDTGVDPEHVWAASNSRDPIADLGNHGWFHLESALPGAGLGDDPTEDDFGANRFRAESTTRHAEAGLGALDDHAKYFDHDTESLYNISQIVTGNYDAVMEAGHVSDPWWTDPQDPEWDRRPTSPDTLVGP